MNFAEAFKKLGYALESVRQDWSAEKPDGVCISLWRKTMFHQGGMPYLDLWELHPDGGAWEQKSGHAKRTRHISRAVEHYDGKIDVVLVTGEPGVSYQDAEPWDRVKRGGYWKITKFDPESGFFRAEIEPNSISKKPMNA